MSLSVGQRLGELTVVARMGEGTHAHIYKVVDDSGSEAALKVLQVADAMDQERLQREGFALSRILHPNVVQLYDVLDVEGRPALLLQLIEGPTLAEWLDAGRVTNHDEALQLFRGMARGVQAVHSVGLVHRDIQPGNILLARSASKRVVPKLVDFGHVRLPDAPGITRPGALGTPSYMAPEQMQDARKVTDRSDQFSLGCVLYEMIAGEQAFQQTDIVSLHQAAQGGDYLPLRKVCPEAPDYVCEVVDRMLKADPSQRFPSITDVLEMLYLDDVPDVTEDSVPAVFRMWSEAEVSTPSEVALREWTPAERMRMALTTAGGASAVRVRGRFPSRWGWILLAGGLLGLLGLVLRRFL